MKKFISLLMALIMAMSLCAPAWGAGEDVVEIGSAEALATFRDAVNGGNSYEGKTVKLTADIDLDGYDWIPIGSGEVNGKWIGFNGIFDGQNHTISNIKITKGGGWNGLFGLVGRGTSKFTESISNLTVKNVTIENANRMTGGIVGQIYGNVENCHVENVTITAIPNATATGYDNGDKIGGIVGWHGDNGNNHYIKNCTAKNVTLKAYRDVGGITGYVGSSATVENCSVDNASITVDQVTNHYGVKDTNAGGIVGRIYEQPVTIQNNTEADVDIVVYASDSTMLEKAIASGASTVTLADGNYKMPSSGTDADIKISGSKNAVIDMTMGAYLENATLSFEGVTIKTGTGLANGNGSDYAALYSSNVTYTGCTFVGPMRVGRDGAKFIDCTFTNLGNDYVWNYGNDVTFEGCVFNTDGKAILLYNDGGTEVAKVTVKGCTFNATAGAKAGAISNQNCAAIEIQNYGNGAKLTTSGNTVDTDFSGEWRIKQYDKGGAIAVNGTTYTQTALDGNLMTVVGTVATVYYTYSFSANGGTGTMDGATVASGTEITLPANGFTAPSGKQFKGWATSASGTVITEKTYTVSAPTTFYAIWENIPVYYPPVVETPAEKPAETPTQTPTQTPVETPVEVPTEVVVPVGGNESAVKVEASVSGTTATIDKVDMTELETVIGNDVDTGKVTIDFSGVIGSTEPAEEGAAVEIVPVDTVEIPAEVIKEIAAAVADPENNAESLEIVLGDGASIEFDAAALAEKVEQAGGEDITISIKPTTAVAENLSEALLFTVGENVAFDITVSSGGVAISDMGGEITITAPYELAEGETAEGIVVYYVDDEGNREKCETFYDAATGRVSWKTNHLSVYMIAHEAADDGAANDGAVDETPAGDAAQGGSMALWVIIAVVVIAAIVAVVVVSKKRKA